jgi:Ca2+-binding RTX toxin-like protein
MRRTILLLATTTLAVLVLGGVALALNSVNCVSGASRCDGTSLDDLINGSQQEDLIFARHGDDTVNGNGAHDEIHGGGGNDTLNGNADGDTFFGDGGGDTLVGGDGEDNFSGGRGPDTINAAFNDTVHPTGFEVSVGGRGDDHIYADDGQVDHIGCGDGTDVVDRDSQDIVSTDCETKN